MSWVSGRGPGRRIVAGAAWAGLLCMAVVGCSGVAVTGSPAIPRTSTSAQAAATATSTSIATATTVASAPSQEAATDGSPTPEPTSAGTPELLSTASTLPAGPLTAIHWYRGPLVGGDCEPTFDTNGFPITACPTFHLFSWSRGYIVFAETDNMLDKGPVNSISVYSSADGIKWSKPTRLNMTGVEDSGIRDVVEGPAGLLAIGYSTYVATCSSPDPSIHSLWLSKDGVAWSQISVSAAFGTRPNQVAAGSRGYIATGGSTEPELWTSSDARTWTRHQLPFAIYRSASISGPVAFDGGFLIYGQVIEPGGCGGDYSQVSTVWFSLDGGSWTREVLPGAVAASSVETSVTMIDTPRFLPPASRWTTRARCFPRPTGPPPTERTG